MERFFFDHETFQRIYNCSFRSHNEWSAYGKSNVPLGIVYLMVGVTYEASFAGPFGLCYGIYVVRVQLTEGFKDGPAPIPAIKKLPPKAVIKRRAAFAAKRQSLVEFVKKNMPKIPVDTAAAGLFLAASATIRPT